MALAKVNRPSTLPVAGKERKGSLDNLFAQKTEKDPFLSLSKTSDSPFQLVHLLHALDQGKQDNGTEKKEDQPIDSHEKYLPGWPLVPSTLSKMEMQKCERCSMEFCSTINYRRHIRMHRRSPNIDKDFQKNRDQVGEFWDKLALEEVKDIVSLDDVDIEGTSGSTIMKYLLMWNHRHNISSLPPAYINAGSLLSDIVQGKPGCLPLTSNVLFSILDDASENTFMCAGNATMVQKFLFDGDADKIITEMKNLVACISYLLELKLVRAWLADKAAEALRCQKLLVEEEEAAQKRRSELIEKKRLKKLRQKRDKQKDASEPGSKAPSEMIEDAIVSPGVRSPTAQSESGSSSVEEATKSVQIEPEINHDEIDDHDLVFDGINVEDTKSIVDPEIQLEHRSEIEDRDLVFDGINVEDKKKIVDPEIQQEHPSDSKSIVEPENKLEHPCDKVDVGNERGPISSESLEVLIGSISVAVDDSSLVGSGLTQLRSVDCKENCISKDTRREHVEQEKNSVQSENVGSYEKSAEMLDICKEPSLEWRNMVPGPRLFSCKEAAALLALRWREAIASDHVTLVLSPEKAAADMYPESPVDQCKFDSVENLSDMVCHATKPKPKSRK